MERKSIAYDKSKRFALRIVKMHDALSKRKVPRPLLDQVLRSGTSIGANLAEASRAVSRADFVSKVSISLKESEETRYWLELLHDAGNVSDVQFESLISDCRELIGLLTATTKTMARRFPSAESAAI